MPGPLLPIALGISSAFDAFGENRAANDARELSEAELKLRQQQWGEREPLRALGLSRLQQARPERPDQSAAFADPTNPFARAPQVLGFGGQYEKQQPVQLDDALRDYRGLALGPWGQDAARRQAEQAVPEPTRVWNDLPTFVKKQFAGNDPNADEVDRLIAKVPFGRGDMERRVRARMGG